jgi:PBP1b-binding outer membrane lipoprotein LpoB
MRRILVTVAGLALLASGCGAAPATSENKFKGEQQQVAKVVDDLAAAGRKGDAERICSDILSKQLVAELKSAGGECLTEMDRAIDDADDYDLQVTNVKVNGSNATAQVRQGKDGAVATFSFVKEGGAWRASALGT